MLVGRWCNKDSAEGSERRTVATQDSDFDLRSYPKREGCEMVASMKGDY